MAIMVMAEPLYCLEWYGAEGLEAAVRRLIGDQAWAPSQPCHSKEIVFVPLSQGVSRLW